MPQIRSAKKRMRQADVRNQRNRVQRARLRSAIKKVRSAASREEAAKAMAEAESLIDRAGRKNLIHRNAAARYKSSLRKAVAGHA